MLRRRTFFATERLRSRALTSDICADGKFAVKLAKSCSSEASERIERRKSTAYGAEPDCPKCAGPQKGVVIVHDRALFLVESCVSESRGPHLSLWMLIS